MTKRRAARKIAHLAQECLGKLPLHVPATSTSVDFAGVAEQAYAAVFATADPRHWLVYDAPRPDRVSSNLTARIGRILIRILDSRIYVQ
jgi:hypothetical protein